MATAPMHPVKAANTESTRPKVHNGTKIIFITGDTIDISLKNITQKGRLQTHITHIEINVLKVFANFPL